MKHPTSHCPFLMLNVKQKSCKHQFLVIGLTRPEIEPESTRLGADAVSTRLLIGSNNWELVEMLDNKARAIS